MKSNLLTIAIPTYNRELILEEALADLIPKIKMYNLEIVVSDNASTDNTKAVVEKYMLEYPHIIYFRQPVNIIDKNFVTCQRLATSKYVWLLGDSSRIYPQQLGTIIDFLDKGDLSALIMNADMRVKDVPSKIFTNPTNLLEELGWHMGLISSSIVLKEMSAEAINWRYMETTFIHMGSIFEYLCLNPASKVYWLNEDGTTPTKLNRSSTSWSPHAFDIYGKGWMAFVLMLPSQISLDSKFKCIKDHSTKQGLFEIRNLIDLRSKGWLNYWKIKPFKAYMPFLTNTPSFIIFLISLDPLPLLSKRLFKYYNSVRKLFKKNR